ncbi:MAG: Trm112 family protein [Candidatus Omnitrophota bacterium]
MPLDPALLAILVCPETKQKLLAADRILLERLNGRIAERRLTDRSGRPVERLLQDALIRADRKILYPIRDGIPVMLAEEAILLEGASE